MAYFSIYSGLRGCYMPDNIQVIKADTRKALKQSIEWECNDLIDSGAIGLNKKAIAWLANAAWKNRNNKSGEYVMPYRHSYQSGYPMAVGVFTGNTRADYLAYMEGEYN